MQFLVLVRRRIEAFTEEEFMPHLEAEAQRVRELYAQGTIRSAWSRQDVAGGCLLFECGDIQEAEAAVQSLPLVQRAMSETQIIALKGYRGFGPRDA